MFGVNGPNEVRVFCVNEGEKTALNYFWHLALPKESLGGHNFKGPANSTIHMADDLFLDGIAFTRVVGTVPTPLFPTRLARVATFHAHASSKRVLCMTVSEDGSYPTENMSDLEICNSFDPLAEDT